MGAGGRLVIPAHVRRRLGLEPGAAVVVSETPEGDLTLSTPKAGLRRARALVRRYVPADARLADELIQDRRAEARGE